MVAGLDGLAGDRKRITFALLGQHYILLQGQLSPAVSGKRRLDLFERRGQVLRSNDLRTKEFCEIVLFSVGVVAVLEIARVDSPVMQIGDVAHGRYRYGQI